MFTNWGHGMSCVVCPTPRSDLWTIPAVARHCWLTIFLGWCPVKISPSRRWSTHWRRRPLTRYPKIWRWHPHTTATHAMDRRPAWRGHSHAPPTVHSMGWKPTGWRREAPLTPSPSRIQRISPGETLQVHCFSRLKIFSS